MFLQFHILTAFPPHNVNRDEDGRPKTTNYGGVLRGRVSSQARKRAIRMAGGFAGFEWVDGALSPPPPDAGLHRATRTREAGLLAYDHLRGKGAAAFPAVLAAQAVIHSVGGTKAPPPLSPKDAEPTEAEQDQPPEDTGADAPAASQPKAKGKGKKPPFEERRAKVASLEAANPDSAALQDVLCSEKAAGDCCIISNQGLVLSTREIARLMERLGTLEGTDEAAVLDWARRLAKDTKQGNGLLLKEDVDEDIALFGRMVAANPDFNEEASVSLSHAITTHAYAPEGDYFSAGEELNVRGGTGAAITSYAYFGGGVYYQHAVVDVPHLRQRLCGDDARTRRALQVLLHGLATAQPRGRVHAFSSGVVSPWIACDAGTGPTCNLALAFLRPVRADEAEGDLFAASVRRLQRFRTTLADAYGGQDGCVFNAWPGLRASNEPLPGEQWTLTGFEACVLALAELRAPEV